MSSSNVKYSICICNFNMADTLRESLLSIINQINNDFEIVIVDDGSDDDSLNILYQLQIEYPHQINIIPLKRKFSRKLGETRNISIENAKGEHVILHIDTDDIWAPYITDFCKVYEIILQKEKKRFLLSGEQINIAPRSLLKKVKYRNTQRAQDRDLWLRLASIDRFYKLYHKQFFKRMHREKKHTFFKSIKDTYNHLLYDLRRKTSFYTIFKKYIRLMIARDKRFTFKSHILKLMLLPASYIASKFYSDLLPPKNIRTFEDFKNVRESKTLQLNKYLSSDEKDLLKTKISEEAQSIFFI